jgi:hypothetical protein
MISKGKAYSPTKLRSRRSNWAYRVLPLLFACVLVTGCVGISVSTTKSESFQNPRLAENAYARALRSPTPGETNSSACTSAWLESHWGKPTGIRYTPGAETIEVWTYSFDLNWNGAILFVLIPIPLEVPIGRERVELWLRDGRVVGGEQRFTHTAGGIVGYSLGPCGPTGFGAHSLSD